MRETKKFKILPGGPEHKKLEEDVQDFLQERKFIVTEATYHTVLPTIARVRLQEVYSPTALYVRGRADRIAIHKRRDIVFEWEAKTHESEEYHDMTLEALPLCHHLIKAQLDVECLYVYRNPHKNHEVGFWIRDLPAIRNIMIPERRWSSEQVNWFESQFRSLLPETKIIRITRSRGTGDPFLIIDESVVSKLFHWKDCIYSILGEGEF